MSTRRKRKLPIKEASIEAPAIIRPHHVKDRAFVTEGGEKPSSRGAIAGGKAWRAQSPLEMAYAKGQLAGGAPKHDAPARLEAGRRYEKLFVLALGAGRDSTDMDRIDTSFGSGSLSESQSAAIRQLIAVESRLSRNDRLIVRMVCGQGYWPSEAVRTVCADYRHTIPARLREALDGLVEAFAASRRQGTTFGRSSSSG